MSDSEKLRAINERLIKQLTEQGFALEAGWQIYRLLCLKTPPHEARDDLHEAFNAGCEHVFAVLIGMLEPGREPTANDMRRMDLVNAEMEPIRQRLRLKYGRTMGRA